jgi:C1A family cysteine protease
MTKWILALALLLSLSLVAQPMDRDQASREIDMLNAMLELDNATWRAGMTEVSMLPYDELQGMMGLIEPEANREEFVFDASRWPGKGQEVIVKGVTKVKNQKQCGSCVAFGTTAAFEQTYWKKNNKKEHFSERYLFFCSPNAGYGCNGGWSLNGGAVAASNTNKGMILDDECKYFDGSYHYDCGDGCNGKAQKYTMSYKSVSSNGYMDVLDDGYAIIMGMIVYEDFRNYKNGVYEHLSGSRLGGHCMVMVGYGTSKDGEHYWIIKNSWSETWGDKGYLRIRIKDEQQKKDSNAEDYGGYYFK